MLILIAESKTMATCSERIGQSEYVRHVPALEETADEIMLSLRDMSAAELSKAVKISPVMAVGLQRMIYEFPNKELGSYAINAFTGVVFRAFGYATLSTDAKKRTAENVRVISSLYGWLRPDDIIKQYRFDFTTLLAPGLKTFCSYWRDRVTECLVDEIVKGHHASVLNLLPSDAAKCIDWKRVEGMARVLRADFKEIRESGVLKTPVSNRLKTLRGMLLRQMASERIDDAASLSHITSEAYFSQGIDSDGVITLLCE